MVLGGKEGAWYCPYAATSPEKAVQLGWTLHFTYFPFEYLF